MNEVSWNNNQGILPNQGHPQQEMAGIVGRQPNANVSGSRSQDDATVGYFFQRPQSDTELNSYGHKRWAVGDDSVLEQVARVDIYSLCL